MVIEMRYTNSISLKFLILNWFLNVIDFLSLCLEGSINVKHDTEHIHLCIHCVIDILNQLFSYVSYWNMQII